MKKISKIVLVALVASFIFVGSSFATDDMRHPFDVYSGSFGPDVFGFKLGEVFDAEAIYHSLQDKIDEHNDGDKIVVKLVYDFYTPEYKDHVKFISSRFSFTKNDNFILLERTKGDFSEAKDFEGDLKDVKDDIGVIPDIRLIRIMKNYGYTEVAKAVSLKSREDDKTIIAIITDEAERISMIRINTPKKDIEKRKFSYESIVEQAVKNFNLKGLERQTDKQGNEYYMDNRVGYKVKFYKEKNGDINTILSLAVVK